MDELGDGRWCGLGGGGGGGGWSSGTVLPLTIVWESRGCLKERGFTDKAGDDDIGPWVAAHEIVWGCWEFEALKWQEEEGACCCVWFDRVAVTSPG